VGLPISEGLPHQRQRVRAELRPLVDVRELLMEGAFADERLFQLVLLLSRTRVSLTVSHQIYLLFLALRVVHRRRVNWLLERSCVGEFVVIDGERAVVKVPRIRPQIV